MHLGEIMRKSVYYLVANTISLVAALIVMAAMGNVCPLGVNGTEVTALTDSWSIPLIIVVAIEALSIIYCIKDVSDYGLSTTKEKSAMTVVFDAVMGILTVGGIFFTWLACILEAHNYNIGNKIAFPLVYTILFVVGLVLLLVSSLLSKKNPTSAISLIFASIIVVVAGIAYDCVSELYVILPVLAVAILVFLIPTLITLKKKRA